MQEHQKISMYSKEVLHINLLRVNYKEVAPRTNRDGKWTDNVP